MRRRESLSAVPDWPPHLADFEPLAWERPADVDRHPDTVRRDRWFRWVGARQDWLMEQGHEQGTAGELAWDTDVRPDRE